jgi:hypothetical protein
MPPTRLIYCRPYEIGYDYNHFMFAMNAQVSAPKRLLLTGSFLFYEVHLQSLRTFGQFSTINKTIAWNNNRREVIIQPMSCLADKKLLPVTITVPK